MNKVKFKHLYVTEIPPSISRIAWQRIINSLIIYIHQEYGLKKAQRLWLKFAPNDWVMGLQDEHLIDPIGRVPGYVSSLQAGISKKIGAEWRRSKGGTFPKRLSSLLYKELEIKLNTKLMSEIGTLASVDNISETLYWDIYNAKNEVWWDSGNFGDDGSCLWGDRSCTRDAFTEYGFMAIRTYRIHRLDNAFSQNSLGLKTLSGWFKHMATKQPSSLHKYGRGRAWLYYIKSKDAYVVWNGYDGEKAMTALHYARLLATMLGYVYHKIELLNEGDDSGRLYINDGSGWLVYASNNQKAVDTTTYDFEMDIEDNHKNEAFCDDCEDYYDEDDMTYTACGRTVCEHCLDNYRRCEWSEEWYYHDSDDIVYISNSYRGILPGISNRSYTYHSGWYNKNQFKEYIALNEDTEQYEWIDTLNEWSDGTYHSEPEEIEEEVNG